MKNQRCKRVPKRSLHNIESFAETEAVDGFLFGASENILGEVYSAIEIIRTASGKALQRVIGRLKDKKAELIEKTK